MVEQVRCPECNQRLLDTKAGKAEICIKCPRCRKVVTIYLPTSKPTNKKIHTEQRR